MSTWAWIVIAIVAILVIAAVAWWLTRGRAQRLEQQRSDASVMRDRARVREEKAQQSENLAREQAQVAQRERQAAQAAASRADQLDPDVE
jgi:uncharacterized protein HemX